MRALILSRLLIDYAQILLRIVGPKRRNAEGLADALLLAAVYVGQHGGRPMTAHKLAQVSGIPRPTVARKMRELEAVGLLVIAQGAGRVSDGLLDSPEFDAESKRVERLLHRTCRQLSKLDTDLIAQREKK